MWWVGEILQWTRPCFEVSQSTSSTVFRFRTDTLLIFSALLMLFWFSFHTFFGAKYFMECQHGHPSAREGVKQKLIRARSGAAVKTWLRG